MLHHFLFDSPKPLTQARPWDGNLQPFTHFAGYSIVGHLILTNPKLEWGIADPLVKRYKNYGNFASGAEFEQQILSQNYVQNVMFRGEHLSQFRKTNGVLQEMQVYYPVPYPFLGGSGAPETYGKGNLIAFLSIVGQFYDLTSRGGGGGGGKDEDIVFIPHALVEKKVQYIRKAMLYAREHISDTFGRLSDDDLIRMVRKCRETAEQHGVKSEKGFVTWLFLSGRMGEDFYSHPVIASALRTEDPDKMLGEVMDKLAKTAPPPSQP